MLNIQTIQPLLLVGGRQVGLGLFGQSEEIKTVLCAPLIHLAGFLQAIGGVLPHGFQHAVTGGTESLFRLTK